MRRPWRAFCARWNSGLRVFSVTQQTVRAGGRGSRPLRDGLSGVRRRYYGGPAGGLPDPAPSRNQGAAAPWTPAIGLNGLVLKRRTG
ncbi:hypothetical protein GCM10010252_23110 [Streptomyces aureoverticillatus]|nr:hypothetical protein GCM10010252_23110 [Streptomyces aureoverticillatus]